MKVVIVRLGDIRESRSRTPCPTAEVATQGRNHGPKLLPSACRTGVRQYLEHVKGGAPIRVLVRRSEVHASTVLRQVRQLESRRNDLLVGATLRRPARRFKLAPPETNSITSHDPKGPRRNTG